MDINSGVKIRLVQMEVTPANPRKNFDECKHYVDEAKRDWIQVVVFPELCISGYLIGDMWEELSFLEDCEHYGEMLAKESTASTAIIFGNVYVDRNLHGTDGRVVKLNGAFVAYNGTFVKNKFTNLIMYPKTLLPNYREFEEPRHFKDFKWYSEHTGIRFDDFFLPYTLFGVKFGITICEDGWDRDYIDKPVKNVVNAGADIVINLSCSPFTLNKNVSRDRVFSAHAKDNEIPICYVNSIGLQNNGKTLFTFDGSTIAYNLTGNTISTIDMFTEGTTDVVMFAGELYPVGIVNDNQYTEIEQTYNAIIYGIRKYMEMSGLKKVVIGSSGGVDSAVSATLYVDAIGAENVYLVNMPSRYNSATTKGLSQQLADNLGTPYTVVPIGDSVELTKAQIDAVKFTDANGTIYPEIKLSAFNLENVQARDRSARVLSANASAIGAVFTNNGNKSETTVGYCVMPKQYTWSKSNGFSKLSDYAINDVERLNNNVIGVFNSIKNIKYTISTCLGNQVECSDNHLIKTQNKHTGLIEFKRADLINKNDDLICCRIGDGIFANKNYIGNFEYIKSEYDHQSAHIEFPTEISEDVAKFIGICIADGSYGVKNVYTITSTKPYVHEFIRNTLKSFGLPATSYIDRKSKRYDCLGIQICNSQFVAWLKWLGISQYADKKVIPQCIKTGSRTIIDAFLAGLLLDSSCNCNTHELRELTYNTASEAISDFVHQCLLNMGILSYKKVINTKIHKNRYEIYIPSVESARLLTELMPIKKTIVTKCNSNVSNRIKFKGAFDYVYGHFDIRMQLARAFERNGIYATSLKHKTKINRNVAMKFLNHILMDTILADDNKIDQYKLSNFIQDVYGVDRYFPITNIEYSHGSFDMIDIALDHKHEFSANGITVHNCTLLGDHAGFMATIADLWKTQVYALGAYINERHGKEVIPTGIFTIVASAELSDAQNVDEGKGDPIVYWYHDFLFRSWVEKWDRATPTEILEHYIIGDLFKFIGINRPEDR